MAKYAEATTVPMERTLGGRQRAAGAVDQEWEQGKRARWRALALVLKAKLEAINAGITTLEDEFLSQVVLPSGQTVVEWLGPQLAEVYPRATAVAAGDRRPIAAAGRHGRWRASIGGCDAEFA